MQKTEFGNLESRSKDLQSPIKEDLVFPGETSTRCAAEMRVRHNSDARRRNESMSNETEKGTFAVKAGLAQVRNILLYRFRASSRRVRGRDRVDGGVRRARLACTRLGAYVDVARANFGEG